MLRVAVIAVLAGLVLAAPVQAGSGAQAAAERSEREALARLDAYRESLGLRPLKVDARLRRAALAHSRDMVAHAYFDHMAPDGSSVGERVSRAGYRWRAVGENLAWGKGMEDPGRWVIGAWRRSVHHDRAMRNAAYRDVGLGVVCKSADACTFTLVLATRS